MNVKFSEDVVPLSNIKINPGKYVRQTVDTHRPVLLTSRGKGVAVMQSLNDYEKGEEERVFMRAVMQGISEIESGKAISMQEVVQKLELVPKINSEEEECSFWESHDSSEYVDWSKAKKALLPNLKPSTKSISIRLPEDLLERIKVEANRRDVPYQSLIKVWLREHTDKKAT